MSGWLFKRLEEGIECRLRWHVYLVDNEHLVSAHLRWYLHLLDEFANVVDGVVRSSVELVNIVRTLLVESLATFTLVASLALRGGREAVDLSHASRTTKQLSMRQFALSNCVLQRSGQGLRSHHAVEVGGAILSGRYDIVVHCAESLWLVVGTKVMFFFG